MSSAILRDTLNRLRWHPEEGTEEVRIAYISREAGIEVVNEIELSRVREIISTGVVLADGTFLPYHRFVRVRRSSVILWQATVRRGNGKA